MKYQHMLMLTVLSVLSGELACVGRPETLPSEELRAEPVGVGTASSGVVHPEKTQRGRQTTVKDALNLGEPSQNELAEINRLNLPPGMNPRKVISKFVEKLCSKEGPPILQRARLQFLENTAVRTTFPDAIFYTLQFPQWPLAFPVPEPLGNNNIFVFDKSGKPLLITSAEAIEKLLRDRLHGIKDAKAARTATMAYLALSEELAQDGMYQFTIAESDTTAQQSGAGITTSGKAIVKPAGGNSGEITAKLVFNPQGDLVSAHQTVNLQAGMRPICQSTKLLDSDPIVRRMAEQDILMMGSAAKPYLDEQRKILSPELQTAIDKIWERIVREGR